MALDTSLALRLNPIQVEPQTNAFARMIGLQGQMRQNELGSLQVQQTRQQMTQQQEAAQRAAAEREFLAGNDVSTPQGLSGYMKLNPRAAMEMQKAQLEAQRAQAGIKKDETQTKKTEQEMRRDQVNQHLQSLAGVNDPAQAQAWIQSGMAAGLIDMQRASAAAKAVPQDPAQFAQWKRGQMMAGVEIAKQFDIANQDRTFAATQANNLMIPDGKGGYMVNQPLAAAKSSVAAAGKSNISINTGQKGLDNELKLRGDFRQEPVYKAHQEMQSAHGQIKQAIAQASPAGDLAAATKIMKLLDPGSVVRESELGMAMAATGMLDRVSNYGNMILTGQKLSPAQRKDFGSLADRLMGESVKAYNAKRGEYENLGGKYGMDMGSALGPKSADVQPTTPKNGPQVLKFDANGNMVK